MAQTVTKLCYRWLSETELLTELKNRAFFVTLLDFKLVFIESWARLIEHLLAIRTHAIYGTICFDSWRINDPSVICYRLSEQPLFQWFLICGLNEPPSCFFLHQTRNTQKLVQRKCRGAWRARRRWRSRWGMIKLLFGFLWWSSIFANPDDKEI